MWSRPTPRMLVALQLLGALWTSPNTLLGLLAGIAGLAGGARPHWSARDRALVFAHWPWGPGGAITFGNVILHTGAQLQVACHTYAHRDHGRAQRAILLDDHERAHVYQYLVLGPLFLPLYLACGGVRAGNRFERAADRYARFGRGWWPWPRRRRRAVQ